MVSKEEFYDCQISNCATSQHLKTPGYYHLHTLSHDVLSFNNNNNNDDDDDDDDRKFYSVTIYPYMGDLVAGRALSIQL